MLRRSEKWIRELARAVNVGVDSMPQDDSLRLRLNRLKKIRQMERIMRKILFAAIVFAVGMSVDPAGAMPFSTGIANGEELIARVAQGCGPGFHRGPYGACRPLYSCPRGWHPGRYGRRCFRNF